MYMYDAIFVRKSTHNYVMKSLDTKILANLMNYTKYIMKLEEEYQVTFKIIDNINGDSKEASSFPIKAPYYLLIAAKTKEFHLLNVGFMIEQVALYLTARGIGTCFVTPSKSKLDKMNDTEYPVVFAMAFGMASEALYRDFRKARRIKEEKLATYKCEPTNDMKLLIKAASLAPSSSNNQPWRFVLYDNRIHIFAQKDPMFGKFLKTPKEVEIGMMLANLILTAEELWLETTIKRQENIGDRRLKSNDYITTVFIK